MYYQCFNRTGLQGYLPSEAVISGAHAICMVPLTCKSTNVFERQLRQLRHQRSELTQFVRGAFARGGTVGTHNVQTSTTNVV